VDIAPRLEIFDVEDPPVRKASIGAISLHFHPYLSRHDALFLSDQATQQWVGLYLVPYCFSGGKQCN
jgi:hypothetical protein